MANFTHRDRQDAHALSCQHKYRVVPAYHVADELILNAGKLSVVVFVVLLLLIYVCTPDDEIMELKKSEQDAAKIAFWMMSLRYVVKQMKTRKTMVAQANNYSPSLVSFRFLPQQHLHFSGTPYFEAALGPT